MTSEPGYRSYVEDDAHMREYSEYQRRYAATVRESDKVLLDLVAERLPAGGGSLVDVGCSTGNLLLHLRHRHPDLKLHGADIVGSVLEENRRNPDLAGVEFHRLDMLEPPDATLRFDVVTANAALMFFTPEEFRRAIANLGAMLLPGGHLVAFDYFHPFDQEVEVTETSSAFPSGLRYHFRGEPTVRRALAGAGLADAELRPFAIPIDLARPEDPADISTWTRRTAEGEGLSFRGTVFQPWCHLVARKEAR